MSFGSDDAPITMTGGGIYEPAEPFVQDILQESARLYGSDLGREFFPGSTVIPFAPETQAAMDLQKGLGFAQTGQSPLLDIASGAMGGFASGVMPTAYSQLTPQADFLSGVRQSIGQDVMGDIATRFGSMGRTGTSPGATAAATRAFTDAYAPFALSQAEAERRAEQTSIENQIGRQLTAAQGLAGLQSDIDTRRSSGIDRIFDVGARQEDLAARNLQEQIDRFQFAQTNPFDRLSAFSQLPFAAAQFQMPTTQFGSAPSPLTSAYGGGQMGYALGNMFGMGPAGAALGIGAGLLGF
tara:strand:+ start:4430 stop:5320 length:891 start_codon:yes stop_codon:yes gene_type:complete